MTTPKEPGFLADVANLLALRRPYRPGGAPPQVVPEQIIERMADALEDLAYCEITPETIEEGQAAWQTYVSAVQDR